MGPSRRQARNGRGHSASRGVLFWPRLRRRRPNLTTLSLGILALGALVFIHVLLRDLEYIGGFYFTAAFAWIQAAAFLVCESIGLERSRFFCPQAFEATCLSLVGVIVLVLGFRLGVGRDSMMRRSNRSMESLARFRPLLLFQIWLAGLVIWTLVGSVGAFGGLRNLFASFAVLRFAPLVLLFARAHVFKEKQLLALAALAVEVALGASGFFSGFKGPLFLSLVTVLSFSGRTGTRAVVARLVVGVALLGSMVTWQAVKEDYRSFQSDGSGTQAVVQSRDQSLGYLARQVGELEVADLVQGSISGLQRVAYVEFFGLAIRMVPSRVPHTNGELWTNAVMNPLRPRVLFPDKETYDDSALTNQFTGAAVAGSREGTSISMGWMAEAYIDFGRFGMFVPIFLVGLALGAALRSLTRSLANPWITSALSTCLFVLQPLQLEVAAAKQTGSLVMSLILIWGIQFALKGVVRHGPGAPRKLGWTGVMPRRVNGPAAQRKSSKGQQPQGPMVS